MKSTPYDTCGSKASGGLPDQAELIESLMPYALKLARSYGRSLPACYDCEDLECAALEGLVQAAQSYDARFGVPWRAYASLCINRDLQQAIESQSVALFSWAGPRSETRKRRASELSALAPASLDAYYRDAIPAASPTPEEWVLAYDATTRLWRRVQSLPGTDALNLALSLAEDATDAEIAARLGLSRTGAW